MSFPEYVDFFKTKMSRFEMSCPACKQGCNSRALGGTETCFHCDCCFLIECVETCRVGAPDSINE